MRTILALVVAWLVASGYGVRGLSRRRCARMYLVRRGSEIVQEEPVRVVNYSVVLDDRDAPWFRCHPEVVQWLAPPYVMLSAPEEEGGEWTVDDTGAERFVYRPDSGHVYCIRADFRGPESLAVITGWRIRGSSGGTVKRYSVQHESPGGWWRYVREETTGRTRLFDIKGTVRDSWSEVVLKSPVLASALRVCPKELVGFAPQVQLQVSGCKAVGYNRFDTLHFNPHYKDFHTCRYPNSWLSEDDIGKVKFTQSDSPDELLQSTVLEHGVAMPDDLQGKDENLSHFLEADFHGVVLIFRIKIVESEKLGMTIRFRVQARDIYSAGKWVWVTDQFRGGQKAVFDSGRLPKTSTSRMVIFELSSPLVTTAIRIYPQSWSKLPFIKVDLDLCRAFPFDDSAPHCGTTLTLTPPKLIRQNLTRVRVSDLEGMMDGHGAVVKTNGLHFRFLSGPHVVTTVVLKGGQLPAGNVSLVTRFQLHYEDSGQNHVYKDHRGQDATFYTTTHTAKPDSNVEYVTILPRPVTTTRLHIIPKEWVGSSVPVLRAELRGCLPDTQKTYMRMYDVPEPKEARMQRTKQKAMVAEQKSGGDLDKFFMIRHRLAHRACVKKGRQLPAAQRRRKMVTLDVPQPKSVPKVERWWAS